MPFWSSKNEPAPPDVDVVACSAIDCVTDGLVLTFTFVFPGPPLDVDKLRTALFDVVRTKLPRAGCRLVRRNGVRCFVATTCRPSCSHTALLEFHTPKVFSTEEPPIGFSSACYNAPYPRDKCPYPPALPDELKTRPCVVPDVPPNKVSQSLLVPMRRGL